LFQAELHPRDERRYGRPVCVVGLRRVGDLRRADGRRHALTTEALEQAQLPETGVGLGACLERVLAAWSGLADRAVVVGILTVTGREARERTVARLKDGHDA